MSSSKTCLFFAGALFFVIGFVLIAYSSNQGDPTLNQNAILFFFLMGLISVILGNFIPKTVKLLPSNISDFAQNSVRHPGEFIIHEMDIAGINQEDLAKLTKISIEKIEAILNGRAPITAEIAEKLEGIFDLEPSFWLYAQRKYDKENAPRPSEKSEKEASENKDHGLQI